MNAAPMIVSGPFELDEKPDCTCVQKFFSGYPLDSKCSATCCGGVGVLFAELSFGTFM